MKIYTLPDLPYEYNALEPYIDEQTMRLHHDKHHQAYVDNANKVLEKHTQLAEQPLEDLMRNFDTLDIPESDKTMLRNNGGGHLNHSLFWTIMGPEKDIDEELMENIKAEFGSIDSFKEEFTQATMGRFGSGWAWLVETENGDLKIYSTANQDSPYLNNDTPLIGLDVWEHAYYLKYQNKRAEYVENWWNVLKLI